MRVLVTIYFFCFSKTGRTASPSGTVWLAHKTKQACELRLHIDPFITFLWMLNPHLRNTNTPNGLKPRRNKTKRKKIPCSTCRERIDTDRTVGHPNSNGIPNRCRRERDRGREGIRTERMRERLISIKEGPENYTSPLDCKEHRERLRGERVRLVLE